MKASTRLIVSSVLPMVFLTWAVLIALTSLLTLSQEVDEIGIGSYGATSALSYTLWTLPRRAYDYFVYACIIGGLAGLGQLAQSSELIALQALGLSKRKIVWRVLLSVGLLTLVVMALAEMWGSIGDRRADALVAQAKTPGLSIGAKFGMWIKDGPAFFNARQAMADENGKLTELWQVRILEFNAQSELSRVLTAATARFEPGIGWRLNDVSDQIFGRDRALLTQRATVLWASRLKPEQIAARATRPGRQSILELTENIDYARDNGLETRSFEAALWYRISFPVGVLGLLLAGLPFVFGALRSGGLGKRIFLGMVLALAFFFLQRTVANLFETYGWNLATAYLLPPILLGTWGLYRLRQV